MPRVKLCKLKKSPDSTPQVDSTLLDFLLALLWHFLDGFSFILAVTMATLAAKRLAAMVAAQAATANTAQCPCIAMTTQCVCAGGGMVIAISHSST